MKDSRKAEEVAANRVRTLSQLLAERSSRVRAAAASRRSRTNLLLNWGMPIHARYPISGCGFSCRILSAGIPVCGPMDCRQAIRRAGLSWTHFPRLSSRATMRMWGGGMAKRKKRDAHRARSEGARRWAGNTVGGDSSAARPITDRRMMEEFFWAIEAEMDGREFDSVDEMNRALEPYQGKSVLSLKPRTEAERAQKIMFQAFGEPRKADRLRLAREALAVSADCADAYVVLAEETEDLEEKIRLYQQGTEAGERFLGPSFREEYDGHFWQAHRTRPYMRARLGLAQALMEAGRLEESIAELRALLELNPQDNQGVRSLLGWLLIRLRRDGEAMALLREHDDGLCECAWNKALVKFRQRGDVPIARQYLQEALLNNRHVLPYLFGLYELPREAPAYFQPGGEDEAMAYVIEYGVFWDETEGALGWVKQATEEFVYGGRTRPQPDGGPKPPVLLRLDKTDRRS